MRVDRVTLRLPKVYRAPSKLETAKKKAEELKRELASLGGYPSSRVDSLKKEIKRVENLIKEIDSLQRELDSLGGYPKSHADFLKNEIEKKLNEIFDGAGKTSKNYQYISSTHTITGGKSVNLHIIKTHANNITFKSGEGQSGIPEAEYGINGGYFTLDANNRGTLNICVKDDVYLFPNQERNNGRLNCKGPGAKGTIIYTGSRMQCKAVQDYRLEIANNQYGADKVNCKWAQGGVSMSLGNSNWESIATKEELVGGTVNRTGIVADSDCYVYLIVTDADTMVSPADFRDAIQKHFGIKDGIATSYMGIFLDGSTCSQLRCQEKSVAHPRALLPLIVLINK